MSNSLDDVINTRRRDLIRLLAIAAVTPYSLVACTDNSTAPAANNTGASNSNTPKNNTPISAMDVQETNWFLFDKTREADSVFPSSVASGDPSIDGVLLWTRIDPSMFAADQKLGFQVALDDRFTHIITQGIVEPSDFSAARDHTLKIDLSEQHLLAANTRYFYRFIYRNTASRVGRCRTLPALNADLSSLRLGVVTCQDFSNGYYAAYHHLAKDDVDFVVHLGDFIYETSADERYQSPIAPDRTLSLPSQGEVASTLADYRYIYRTYRSDKSFQAALEQHTFIIIWDDHETCNDCYWDYSRDTLGAPDHPLTKTLGNDPRALRQLKLDSQQAWSEYVPARPAINLNAQHPHQRLQIYRSFQFGQLLDLILTDQRSYRSAHPCGEQEVFGRYAAACVQPKNQTMLGSTQRDWFIDKVSNSKALWKLWGNEVQLAEMRVQGPGSVIDGLAINTDAWDGYTTERHKITSALYAAGVNNFVTITGDLHSYLVAETRVNFSNYLDPDFHKILGIEFMTPAISSANLVEMVNRGTNSKFGDLLASTVLAKDGGLLNKLNPHIKFFDSKHWGYSVLDFTKEDVTYTAYNISKSKAIVAGVARQTLTQWQAKTWVAGENPRLTRLL